MSEAELLGRGRSGAVYRDTDALSHEIARKVFGSNGLTKLVQSAFLGAPNPYAWNEHAIRCALLRRKVAADLVAYWFGSRLRVAQALEYRWNDRARAYELVTELVDGRHAQLRHPLSRGREREVHEFVTGIMQPLQEHLCEAGLDGLVWQAGLGNPVALGNFMRDDRTRSWVWIDLESGVPALAPLNFWSLLRFYLPASVRHGRPLFDDVDVGTLRGYVEEHAPALEVCIGAARYQQLIARIESLRVAQRRWKEQPRVLRSLLWSASRGRVTPSEVEWYAVRPVRWYIRLLGSAVYRAARKGLTGLRHALARLRSLSYLALLVSMARALTSEEYRLRMARAFVTGRIRSWRDRRQLDSIEAKQLQEQLQREAGAAFMADFGVHLSIKPVVKAIEYWLLPLLFAVGLISASTMAVTLVIGGSLARTAYTLWRIGRTAGVGRERPWIALLVGVLPVVGNLAYPAQMAYSSADRSHLIARFIICDVLTLAGRKVPVWGGPDTQTEHAFNRAAQLLVPSPVTEVPPTAVATER